MAILFVKSVFINHMNMKLVINVLFLLVVLVMSGGCNKDEHCGTFMKFEGRIEANFTIPSGLNTVETHYFIIRDVPTNFRALAASRNLEIEDIQCIVASRGLIRAAFNDFSYDFIDRIQVYAITQNEPVKKREMYFLDFVPLNTGSVLRMSSSTTELKEILLENDVIDLEIRLVLRSFSPGNIVTRLDCGFAVF